MNFKNLISISIVFFMFIVYFGCSDKTEDLNNPVNDPYSSDEFALYEFDDAMKGISDASFDNEMGFHSFFDRPDFPLSNQQSFIPGSDRNGHHPRHGFYKPKRHLGRIIRELNLSEEQFEAVKEFMKISRECLREPFKEFREAAKEIIQEANKERREIIQQVRNGELNREEARELLKALNEATRQAIEECPECVEAREKICECNSSLFENIGSILDDGQLEIWNLWLEDLNRPCL